MSKQVTVALFHALVELFDLFLHINDLLGSECFACRIRSTLDCSGEQVNIFRHAGIRRLGSTLHHKRVQSLKIVCGRSCCSSLCNVSIKRPLCFCDLLCHGCIGRRCIIHCFLNVTGAIIHPKRGLRCFQFWNQSIDGSGLFLNRGSQACMFCNAFIYKSICNSLSICKLFGADLSSFEKPSCVFKNLVCLILCFVQLAQRTGIPAIGFFQFFDLLPGSIKHPRHLAQNALQFLFSLRRLFLCGSIRPCGNRHLRKHFASRDDGVLVLLTRSKCRRHRGIEPDFLSRQLACFVGLHFHCANLCLNVSKPLAAHYRCYAAVALSAAIKQCREIRLCCPSLFQHIDEHAKLNASRRVGVDGSDYSSRCRALRDGFLVVGDGQIQRELRSIRHQCAGVFQSLVPDVDGDAVQFQQLHRLFKCV